MRYDCRVSLPGLAASGWRTYHCKKQRIKPEPSSAASCTLQQYRLFLTPRFSVWVAARYVLAVLGCSLPYIFMVSSSRRGALCDFFHDAAHLQGGNPGRFHCALRDDAIHRASPNWAWVFSSNVRSASRFSARASRLDFHAGALLRKSSQPVFCTPALTPFTVAINAR